MKSSPKQICYYTCFVIVYLLIWGFISVPTIFFYLPSDTTSDEHANATNSTNLASQVTSEYFKSVLARLIRNNQTDVALGLKLFYESSSSPSSLGYDEIKGLARRYNISESIWSRQCNEPLVLVPNSLNCTPPCVFPLLTDPEQTATDVLLAFSIIVTELAGIFTLATWMHLPVLSTFPHIIPLYIVGESMVLGLIWTMPLLITRVRAFCDGDLTNLPGSIETGFCTFQGIGLQYLTVSMALWFFCYTFNIHITIVYNKADYVLRNNRTHLIQSLICWLLPIVNVIVSFRTENRYGNNYHWARSDIFTCTPANRNVYYYCMVLPIQLLMGAAATMIANNVSFLKTSRESTVGMKLVRRATNQSGVSSLEKRFAALGITFVVVVFYDISRATYLLWSGERLSEDVRDYSLCKQLRPDCDESWRQHVAAPLTIISSMTVGVFCLASLLFLVGTPATTQLWKYWTAKVLIAIRWPHAKEKFAKWAVVPKWHRSVTKRKHASGLDNGNRNGRNGKEHVGMGTLRSNTQTVMLTPKNVRSSPASSSSASQNDDDKRLTDMERKNTGSPLNDDISTREDDNEVPPVDVDESEMKKSDSADEAAEVDVEEARRRPDHVEIALSDRVNDVSDDEEDKKDESSKEPLSPEETDVTFL